MQQVVLILVLALLAAGCSTAPQPKAPQAPLPAQLAQHIKAKCPGVLSEDSQGRLHLKLDTYRTGDRCEVPSGAHYELFARWCLERKGTYKTSWEGYWCLIDGLPAAGETFKGGNLVFDDGAKLSASYQVVHTKVMAEQSRHRNYLNSGGGGLRGTISTRDGRTHRVVRVGTEMGLIDYELSVKKGSGPRFQMHDLKKVVLANGKLDVVLNDGTTAQAQTENGTVLIHSWMKINGDRSWGISGDADPGGCTLCSLAIIAIVQRNDGSHQYARFKPEDVIAMSLQSDSMAPSLVLKRAPVDAAAERSMRAWVAGRTPAWVKPGAQVSYRILPPELKREPLVCRVAFKPLSLVAYCDAWRQADMTAERQGYWSSKELPFHEAENAPGIYDSAL